MGARIRTIVTVVVLATAVAVPILTASPSTPANLSRIQGNTYKTTTGG
jgi:hypothetical protein